MITWCHTFPHHIWSSCLMLTPAIFVNNLTTIFNNLQHSSWKCLWKSGIRRHKLHKNVHRKATITLKYLQATATSMWQSRTAECLAVKSVSGFNFLIKLKSFKSNRLRGYSWCPDINIFAPLSTVILLNKWQQLLKHLNTYFLRSESDRVRPLVDSEISVVRWNLETGAVHWCHPLTIMGSVECWLDSSQWHFKP